MPLFSRRLQCFYCNCYSKQRYAPGLSKWQCERCDATNHLDSNGNITDPASQQAAAPHTQYARPVKRSVSPTLPQTVQPLFCQRCLNNQHLVIQSLANYLPARTDPRYQEFERNLPSYRKSLEERYPQVCEECEPRVRDRIKQSGYMAKTDHLRRMREQTQDMMQKMREGWQRTSILTLSGSIIWYLTTAIQLLWHGLGILTHGSEELVDVSVSPKQCVKSLVQMGDVDSSCAKTMCSTAGWMILGSIITIWWNPVMRRRWIDRAVGLNEYYKLQVIMALARLSGWYFLGKENHMDLEPQAVRAIHAIMLAFNIMIPIIAYRTVYIAKKPRVTFQDTYEPLVPARQRSTATEGPTQRITPPNSQGSSSPSPPRHFRYERPTAPAPKIETPVYRPPTPPPEDDDEMDIDLPERKHDLRPSIHRREHNYHLPGPSPFYGKIPAAPVSMERQLRNPPNKPSFQKTSPERQESFFQSMTKGRSAASNSDGLLSSQSTEMEMRPARFFTENDRAAQETGLESWFSDFFSVGEVAAALHKPSKQNSVNPDSGDSELINLWYPMSSILALVLATYFWTNAPSYTFVSRALYFSAVGIAAIVSGTRLRSISSDAMINHSDVLLCLLELFGSAVIGYQIRQALLADLPVHEELGSFPYWYLGFMIFQESSAFVTAYVRLAQSRATKEYVTQQQQPPNTREPSPPREQRALPMERTLAQNPPLSRPSTALSYSSSLRTPARSGFQPVSNSFEQRFTRAQAQTFGQHESPGSNALSSLSLGFDEGPPTQRRSARLRGQAVNPWQVGGL